MNYLQDLSLYLTEKCNLNCTYCYVKKDFESTLTFADTKKAIDIFEDCVFIFLWEEKPFVFMIKNQRIADTFKQYFLFLWKMAKMPKRHENE